VRGSEKKAKLSKKKKISRKCRRKTIAAWSTARGNRRFGSRGGWQDRGGEESRWEARHDDWVKNQLDVSREAGGAQEKIPGPERKKRGRRRLQGSRTGGLTGKYCLSRGRKNLVWTEKGVWHYVNKEHREPVEKGENITDLDGPPRQGPDRRRIAHENAGLPQTNEDLKKERMLSIGPWGVTLSRGRKRI